MSTLKFKRTKTKCTKTYCRDSKRTTLILDVGYLLSPIGICKSLEFMTLLVSFGLIVDFQGHYSFPQTIYFLASVSGCMAYVIVFLFIYFTSIVRIIDFSWSYLSIFSDLACASSMLITSSLLADLTARLYDEKLNPNWCSKILIFSSCSYLAIAAAFGYISCVIFLTSSYFQFKEYNDNYLTHKHYDEI